MKSERKLREGEENCFSNFYTSDFFILLLFPQQRERVLGSVGNNRRGNYSSYASSTTHTHPSSRGAVSITRSWGRESWAKSRLTRSDLTGHECSSVSAAYVTGERIVEEGGGQRRDQGDPPTRVLAVSSPRSREARIGYVRCYG